MPLRNVSQPTRLRFEPLESRQLLTADLVFGDEPFSYVDVDSDGFFNAADGDVIVDAEVADGKFDTDIAEGAYSTVIPGLPGLVLGGDAISAGYIDFRADGELRVRTDLTSGDDLRLTSREDAVNLWEGSEDEDPQERFVNITADDNIKVRAALSFTSWGETFTAGEEFDVEVGGYIHLVNAVVTVEERVEFTADDYIYYSGDGERNGPFSVMQASDIVFEAGTLVSIFESDFEGPTMLAENKLVLDAGESVLIRGADTFGPNTELRAAKMEILAGTYIDIDANQDFDGEAAVVLESTGYLKMRAGSFIEITSGGEFPGIDLQAGGAVEIFAENYIIVEALVTGNAVKIRSDEGGVDVGESEITAETLIDIEAELLADLTDAVLTVPDEDGRLEIEGDTIDLSGAVLAADEFELDGDVI